MYVDYSFTNTFEYPAILKKDILKFSAFGNPQ